MSVIIQEKPGIQRPSVPHQHKDRDREGHPQPSDPLWTCAGRAGHRLHFAFHVPCMDGHIQT
ncbi:MAG: hypothetical protein AMXMBFR13_39270 [Phycisphaerae bacterium]